MENKKETFCPTNRSDWREWLSVNHESSQSIWLICYKTSSSRFNLSWSEAVDEALCFGWIDSLRKPIDKDSFMQFFCKRKPNSTWSKINKEKAQWLIAENLMTHAGYDRIEVAKQNGSWTILDDVERLIIPDDLELEFQKHPDSKEFFQSLSKSVKKAILQWIVLAKRADTREKRIAEVAQLAGQGLKPKFLG